MKFSTARACAVIADAVEGFALVGAVRDKDDLGAGQRLQARQLRELDIVADLDADARQRRVEDLDLLARLDVEIGALDGRDVQRILACNSCRSA
jgi:hypothetical protein